MENLSPLNASSEERIRFFSGAVTYRNTFTVETLDTSHRMILDRGEVREIADVFIHGVLLGTAWSRPFRIDITKAVHRGTNTIQIEVVNTINNRLDGDTKLPPEYRRTSSNVKKLPNAWREPFADAPLLKSGLIGPVRIHVVERLAQ